MKRLLIGSAGLALLLVVLLAAPASAALAKTDLTPIGGATGSADLSLRFAKYDAATDTADLIVRLSVKKGAPDMDYWVFLKVDGGPSFVLGKLYTNQNGNGRFEETEMIDNLSNQLNRTFAVSICATDQPADQVYSTLGFVTVPLK